MLAIERRNEILSKLKDSFNRFINSLEVVVTKILEPVLDYISGVVDKTTKIISKIRVSTDIWDLKDSIENSDGVKIVSCSNSSCTSNNEITSGVIKTGYALTYLDKNEELIVYKLAVSGDVNGDGKINSADLLRIRQHLLETVTLSDIYFTASDINGDKKTNSADLLRVRQYLLDIKPIV